ncbi:hypothetical protein LOD99_3550 [Oopsacas minuta]|uniref:Uncharacterized protein n=1 Tax=Oopsacas minuta TaxID=111878 RepID=A0AAV7JXW5_9METZ|nr:hypothetical protein LOD99_3550 [Oopsacas minuta]
MTSVYPKSNVKSKHIKKQAAKPKGKYNKFDSSSDDFELIGLEDIEDAEYSLPIAIQSQNDYLSIKDNYVLFYIQFASVQNGFFKDVININIPVQDMINRYSKFFDNRYEFEQSHLLVGPRIGVNQHKLTSGYSLSHKKDKRRGHLKDRLSKSLSLAEQKVTACHILIISPPSDAKFNKEMFQVYLNSKTEQTLFAERWLPAVQGSIPQNEDTACVVAACLHTLNSIQNTATSYNSSPRDFIHRGVPVTKLAETKIAKTLEELKHESVENIMKLCTETIQSNFLSGAIIFSVSTSGNTGHKKDAYLVISSESVVLVKSSDLSRLTPDICIKDIRKWTPTDSMLDIAFTNRKNPSLTQHFQIKSNDTHLISSTLTAVAHTYMSNK